MSNFTFLAAEWPDVHEAAAEIAREEGSPTARALARLRERLGVPRKL